MACDVINIQARIEKWLNQNKCQLEASEPIVGEFGLRVIDDVRDPVEVAEDDT